MKIDVPIYHGFPNTDKLYCEVKQQIASQEYYDLRAEYFNSFDLNVFCHNNTSGNSFSISVMHIRYLRRTYLL